MNCATQHTIRISVRRAGGWALFPVGSSDSGRGGAWTLTGDRALALDARRARSGRHRALDAVTRSWPAAHCARCRRWPRGGPGGCLDRWPCRYAGPESLKATRESSGETSTANHDGGRGLGAGRLRGHDPAHDLHQPDHRGQRRRHHYHAQAPPSQAPSPQAGPQAGVDHPDAGGSRHPVAGRSHHAGAARTGDPVAACAHHDSPEHHAVVYHDHDQHAAAGVLSGSARSGSARRDPLRSPAPAGHPGHATHAG